MMVALLLTNSCATTIHDRESCAVVPDDASYGEWAGGAVCDKFLTADKRVLSKKDWEALRANWIAHGSAIECMSSQSVGDIKEEEEELCSKTSCNYQAKKATVSENNSALLFARGERRVR
jgi:hypothetical protein